MEWQFSAPQARPRRKDRTDPTDPGVEFRMAVPAPSRPNGLKGNRRNRFPPKRRPRPPAWVCASARSTRTTRSARTRTRAKPSRASPARVGRMAARLAPFSPCVLGSGAPKIRSNPGSKAGPTDGDPAMRRIAVVGPCRPLLPGTGQHSENAGPAPRTQAASPGNFASHAHATACTRPAVARFLFSSAIRKIAPQPHKAIQSHPPFSAGIGWRAHRRGQTKTPPRSS